jgi:hypothetical protein
MNINKGKTKIVGWDGNSNEIVQVWMPCGCKWSNGGQTLVASCVDHLRSPTK